MFPGQFMWDLVVFKVAVCYSVNPLCVFFLFLFCVKILDKGMSVPGLIN